MSKRPANRTKGVKMVDAIATLVPDNVLEVIFSYLNLHDLRNCSLVCKRYYTFLNDENNDVWRLHCIRKLGNIILIMRCLFYNKYIGYSFCYI